MSQPPKANLRGRSRDSISSGSADRYTPPEPKLASLGMPTVHRLRRPPYGPQPISSASILDDLTVGILWATANTDVALLADDAQLMSSQERLAHYEGRRTSDVPIGALLRAGGRRDCQ